MLDGPAMVYRLFVEDLGRENIPVILVSGHPNLPRIATAIGTPYFLAKPFEMDRLDEHRSTRRTRRRSDSAPRMEQGAETSSA